jgi:hypothetical protein
MLEFAARQVGRLDAHAPLGAAPTGKRRKHPLRRPARAIR